MEKEGRNRADCGKKLNKLSTNLICAIPWTVCGVCMFSGFSAPVRGADGLINSSPATGHPPPSLYTLTHSHTIRCLGLKEGVAGETACRANRAIDLQGYLSFAPFPLSEHHAPVAAPTSERPERGHHRLQDQIPERIPEE